ncbi:MAG: heavy metal translocating P-type ATPase [Planctomycetota bacterium]
MSDDAATLAPARAAPEHPHDDAPEQAVLARVALTLVGGVLVFNGFIAGRLGIYAPAVAEVSAALGALILAAPIVARAVRNLASNKLDLDELIALAVVAAIAFEDFVTAGAVAFFALLGELVERRTALGARVAIESLIRLTPSVARRLRQDGSEEEVEAKDLRPGDRVRVRPGENLPADGVVLSGRSTVDEARITGESLPAEKGPTAEVFAGTVNLTGALEVEVRRAGPETTLGRVKELILHAERSRPPVARVIDRYVAYYLPFVLLVAFIILFLTEEKVRFIAALVVACPTALVLATPTAMVAALSCAARLGILVKDARDLEAASRLTAVLFDKTGTLTTGKLGVARLLPARERDPREVLRFAAALASHSNHPASRAVVSIANEVSVEVPEPKDVQELAGLGLEGHVDGAAVLLGRRSLLAQRGVPLPAEDEDDEALSRLYLSVDGELWGVLGLEDTVRAEAAAAVAGLREQGVQRISIMTGDRWPVARKVGIELGCDDVAAECLPAQKLQLAEAARARGERIAVVGDGVNDAPALAAGDLGIAMGAAGSDVALGSARIALMNNDLRRVPFLVELSRQSQRAVRQNLIVGAGLLVIGLGLAAAGLLTPIMAILLHNLGSLFVIFNSARLIRLGEELATAG